MLTDVALKNLRPQSKPYKSTDRDGLYVYVSPGGAISFLLAARRGGLLDVRAISVFEVEQGVITHWRDHADLGEVPVFEKDRWLRLSRARW